MTVGEVHSVSPPAPDQTSTGLWLRSWRRLDYVVVTIVGLTAIIFTRIVLRAGMIGWPIVAVLGLCLLLIPTSQNLSRRLTINISLACALTYIDWMLPLSMPVTHGARWLALLFTAATISVTLRCLGLIRQLLPQTSVIDLIPPLLAVPGSIIALRRWFAPTSFDHALETMTTAWDNASHYYLVNVMHRTQTLTSRLPPRPDGLTNGLESYPVGYHSSAASLLDLFIGPASLDNSTLAVGFLRTVAIVATLAALLVGSAMAAIPKVRESGWLGALSVGAAMSIMFFGPGQSILLDAHYNFHFAIAMSFAAVSCAVWGARLFQPAISAGLLAAVLCAGGAWLPMGAIAALLSVGVLVKADWSSRRWERLWIVIWAVAVLVLTAISVSWTYGEVAGGVLSNATGGMTALPALFVALVVVGAFLAWDPRPSAESSVLRLRIAHAGAILLILSYLVVESFTLAALGQSKPAYYPQKILNGLVIVSVFVVLAVVCAKAKNVVMDEQKSGLWLKQLLAATLGWSIFLVALIPAFGLAGVRQDSLQVARLDQTREGVLARGCEAAKTLPDDVVGVIASARSLDTFVCEAHRGLNFESALYMTIKAEKRRDSDLVSSLWEDIQLGRAVLIVDPFTLDMYRELVGPKYAERVIPW